MEKTPTVMEAVRLSEGYLQKHGVESPRLSAEHLLAKALRCSRLDLYLRFGERLEEKTLEQYRADLKKRAGRFPLQYILGEVEFMSLVFKVRENVFIPRPETELLVECIEEELGGGGPVRFLELGTGSGVISGALAARNPLWSGVAFDISRDAAVLARENFTRLGVSDRVAVLAAPGFGALEPAPGFDLLVSNPPYVPGPDIDGLQKEVSGFETRAALDGGAEGLDFYPILAAAGRAFLKPGGLIAMEAGEGQAGRIGGMLEGEGYEKIRTRKDYNRIDRIISAYLPRGREGAL
ncbi:MAG: peptide chain release factor N(5)-glutamine methyltransferase [Candidatus Krumholzibacteria bacterium]|jgi:release factor glutamine methyltransferase|nr:peptide chain release factor N(5)-glutamine methyltransferase [Candidatus Krumholzibacteria bacterium]